MPRGPCERPSTEVNAASVIYVIISSTKTSENHSLGSCLNVSFHPLKPITSGVGSSGCKGHIFQGFHVPAFKPNLHLLAASRHHQMWWLSRGTSRLIFVGQGGARLSITASLYHLRYSLNPAVSRASVGTRQETGFIMELPVFRSINHKSIRSNGL